ncbi:two-component system histidine kinase PnpS [Laceyella sacchari]|jgi:two-component system, OmpR family, phosphate regulon sensor histidine kinase PhoR|uniref:histidine kinase n=1 Tax=Laceyella sacchari TaxID=37482 RepID=A0ABY5U4B8_LACSH|nr:ATP-binding protein [Laceyella sacchari]KPC73790.1 hypothetical protein ADL26_12045 [Thermoactinomyces vulgaris]TCW40867.1 two-component system phosphate regulon sensor histidine kinase PhoR [Laceyella sacchari]UWE04482.1 cell wall metabolism sensor histidine kinase WalK [Laceyella sacchari]
MRSLRARITWSFLLLIGCSVLGTGIFVALLLRSSYIDSLTTRLETEGRMLAETITWTDSHSSRRQFQQVAEVYGKALDAQITIFDKNGRVLGDSSGDLSLNYKAYPEVESALQKKKKDPTVIRDNFLHAALPVERDGDVVGAIRISLEIQEVNQSLEKVWVSLALGLMIAYGLAGFFSSRIASSVTSPLEEITQVARDIAQKKFHRRVQQTGNDEVAQLGQAINRMAHSLQKQMETIRKSERRLHSIIESLESGLIMIDPTGKVSLVNRSFERLFGVPAQDIIGRSYTKLTYPYDLTDWITECAESGERMRHEIQIYFPEERMLEANLAPMWVERNGVGVVVVLHDLTAIRRLEQLRKDFVANVSHELKTPITSIRGFSETLLDGAMGDPDTCREFLQIINEESLRLQRLIGELLDLSKIESKQINLKRERIRIDQMVQSVMKTMEERFRAKQQAWSVKIAEPFEVEVDKDRFRQILLNLLSNASNYTPPGGRITVEVEKSDESWLCKVSDTGIGIPKEDLPRVFERFYRVDKARARDSGGTGLGLAIVKHLVEAHQGEIEVTSQIGQGTTFTLSFPMTKKDRNT